MAITINNTNEGKSASVWGMRSSGVSSQFVRTSTVKIKQNGEVKLEDKFLDLGYSGDHNATCLVFDTSELGVDLTRYEQVLIFLDVSQIPIVSQSFQFDTDIFLVPDAITAANFAANNTGGKQYKIFYTLQEKEQETGSPYGELVDEPNDAAKGNVRNRTEIFISQGFSGFVKPSFWSYFLQDVETTWTTATTTVVSTLDSVHKTPVKYEWSKTAFPDEKLVLGEYLDSLITPLEFTYFPLGSSHYDIVPGTYTVYFLFTSKDLTLRYKTTAQYSSVVEGHFKIWVPREVTNEAVGNWQIGIVYESYDTTDSTTVVRRAVSNILQGQVLSNELILEHLKEGDIVPSNIAANLLDADGSELLTENGEGDPIQTIEVTGNSAILSFSGAQVESLLGWVNTKRTPVEACMLIVDSNKDKWNAYDSRIGTLENLNLTSIRTDIDIATATANTAKTESSSNKTKIDDIISPKLKEIDTKVNTVTSSHNQLNEDYQATKTDFETRISSHDRAWVEYNDSLAAIRGYISDEQAARQAQDSLLEASITNEVTMREAAVSNEKSAREAADTALQSQITTNATAIQNINTNIEQKRFIQWEDTTDSSQPLIKQIIFWNGTEEEFLVSSAKNQKDILYLLPEEEDES